MAGSISLSLTQRYDKTSHMPLAGGKLYTYAAGTSTPQNAYQDLGLTIPWPNPIVLDSGGNVPQLFFRDGYVKFRLANAAGVTQIAADFVLVLGPTTGEAAVPSIDATTIMQTGFIAPYYDTGVKPGFVRLNGRTIGSASSGASESATADCQELFEHLWGIDANLSVSTGRGASANADWVANKTIALPDWRGRALAALDDMGNSAAGRLTASYFGTAATVLGAASTPTESKTLVTANLPPYTPSGTVASASTFTDFIRGLGGSAPSTGGPRSIVDFGAAQQVFSNGTLAGVAQGGLSTPFSIVQPTMLTTFYIKK